MLSKPKYGWTEFKLGDFKSRASYLTNIPQDCIDAFIYGLKNHKPITIFFDAEGYEFYLVSDYYSSYIILDDEETTVYYINKGIKEIAKKFVHDIERNYEAWQLWDFPCDVKRDYDLSELKNLLIERKCENER